MRSGIARNEDNKEETLFLYQFIYFEVLFLFFYYFLSLFIPFVYWVFAVFVVFFWFCLVSCNFRSFLLLIVSCCFFLVVKFIVILFSICTSFCFIPFTSLLFCLFCLNCRFFHHYFTLVFGNFVLFKKIYM